MAVRQRESLHYGVGGLSTVEVETTRVLDLFTVDDAQVGVIGRAANSDRLAVEVEVRVARSRVGIVGDLDDILVIRGVDRRLDRRVVARYMNDVSQRLPAG